MSPIIVSQPRSQESGMAAADVAGGCFSGAVDLPAVSGPGSEQPAAVVDALLRIASALERGASIGDDGTPSISSNALAAAAMKAAASVAAGGSGTQNTSASTSARGSPRTTATRSSRTIAPNERPLESSCHRPGAQTADMRELTALRDRAGRLEHEIADLRAQVARRLDSATQEIAASRQESEEARAEVTALRGQVAELSAQLSGGAKGVARMQAPP